MHLSALLLRKRRGTTLMELVISMGLFSILLVILISLTNMTSVVSVEQADANIFYRSADDFIYNLLIETKSAYEANVSPEGNVLTLYFEDIDQPTSVSYQVNNLRGQVTRTTNTGGDRVCLTDFYAINFVPVASTEYRVIAELEAGSKVEYTLCCGSSLEGGGA